VRAVEGGLAALLALLLLALLVGPVEITAAARGALQRVDPVVLVVPVQFVLCGVKAVLAVHHRFLQPM
jgi:hypothetical protein